MKYIEVEKVPKWRTPVLKRSVPRRQNVPLVISNSKDKERDGKDDENELITEDSEGKKQHSAAVKKKKPVPKRSVLWPVVELPIKKVVPKAVKRPLPVSPNKQEGSSKKKAKQATAPQKKKEDLNPKKRPIPDFSNKQRNEDEAVDSDVAGEHISEVSGCRESPGNDADFRQRPVLSVKHREKLIPVLLSGGGPLFVA